MKNKFTMKLSYKLGLALLLLADPVVAIAEWQSSFNRLTGRVVRSMAVAPFNQNLLLVGNKGPSSGDATVFISRNGGISWRFLNSNKPLHQSATDVQAVAYASKNIILAGTWKHGLFRSTDAGQNFKSIANFPSKDVRGFAQTESGLVYAATGNRGVLRSEDQGASWIQTSLNSQYIWSVHSNTNGTQVLASSPNSGLYRLSNRGNSNVKILNAKTHAATASANFSVIAAATESGLYISNDSGANWRQPKDFKGQRLSSVQIKKGQPDVLLIGGWKNGVWEYSLSQQRARQIGDPLPVVHLHETNGGMAAGSWGRGIHIYPDAKSSNYLIEAAKVNDGAAISDLLAGGASPNGYDAQRNTALIFASRDGFTAIAKILIDRGADVNWVDGEKVTPLILASFNNHPGIVRLLLAKGARRDFVDGFGKTAMDYAKERGSNDSVLQMLLN